MKKHAIAAAAAVLLLAGPLTFTCLAENAPALATAEGKALFENTCSRCHKIDRPLAKDMDRAGWEKLLLEMAARGAEMSQEEKSLILDYLSARFVFTTKCTVCHTKERIFNRERAHRDWVATVRNMAAKSPDLLSEQEAAAILSYLDLVLGAPE